MSTRADTWMPLHIGAYLRDTSRLTGMQHGAYLLLLIEAWTHDGLIPAGDGELALITRLTAREWKVNKAAVLRFWTPVEGGFRQKRLDEELEHARYLVSVKSEAGKASAEARKRQRNGNSRATSVATDGATDAQHTARPLPLPSLPSVESSEDKSSGGEPPKSDPPHDPDALAWSEARRLLIDQGGLSRDAAGQFFGKLLRDHGLTGRDMLGAIADGFGNATGDPKSWLTGAAKARSRKGVSPSRTPDLGYC